MRLGELLIEDGVLTAQQVCEALEEQRKHGRPFGLICERLFSIEPGVIEEAWACQYAGLTQTVDPLTEAYDDHARDLISRRQAWQFRVLPIRFEAEDLLMATTQQHLRRALRFACNVVSVPVYFVMADAEPLGQMLCRRYPLPGLTPQSILHGVEGSLNSQLRKNAA